MNQDVLSGKWMQIRGEMKKQWGKLTDDEIDQVQGNADKLAGYLQEKYGYSHEKAEQEAHRFLDRYGYTR